MSTGRIQSRRAQVQVLRALHANRQVLLRFNDDEDPGSEEGSIEVFREAGSAESWYGTLSLAGSMQSMIRRIPLPEGTYPWGIGRYRMPIISNLDLRNLYKLQLTQPRYVKHGTVFFFFSLAAESSVVTLVGSMCQVQHEVRVWDTQGRIILTASRYGMLDMQNVCTPSTNCSSGCQYVCNAG